MLTLRNPRYPDLAPVEAEALVDTDAIHLCLPEHIAVQLHLEEYDRKEIILADGSRRAVPYMGPWEVRFRNRAAIVGALVFGNQVLLGAIPMEDMDLEVIPRSRKVEIHPENPNMAVAMAKGAL